MVIGKREFSVILLVFGVVISTYMALLADPTSAQNGGGGTTGGQGDGSCPGAEEVSTTTGNGNKQSPVFDVTGTSFRLIADSTATSQDPQSAGLTVFVYPEGETVDFVGDFSVEEGRDDSSIVNAGPGRFYLDISAANVDYTIIVEDCVGSEPTTLQPTTPQQSQNGQSQNGQSQNEPTIINIPNKPLPPTGGLPVYGMVAGSVIAGAGLLGLGIGIRRGQRR